MKILTAAQVQEVDRQTLIAQRISSLELMERASEEVVKAVLRDLSQKKERTFSLLCGGGNNGGDGLVIARLLLSMGEKVKVHILKAARYSSDNVANQSKIDSTCISFFDLDNIPYLSDKEVIIDCLFGAGLSRPLSTEYRLLVDRINAHPNLVLSVDMPSGLLADHLNESAAIAVKPDKIYTFQTPKMALLLPDNHHFTREFEVLDIGLDKNALDSQVSHSYYIDEALVASLVKMRTRYSHKGSFGHVVLIGGSYGKIGAMSLCCLAAMKAGCGLCTVYVPRCGYICLQTAVPEVMVLTDPEEELISIFPTVNSFSAVGVGMGMGQESKTKTAFFEFLQSLSPSSKLVLDADALNLVASRREVLSCLPFHTIMTPHPKELERLIGKWSNDIDKIEKVKEFSSLYQVIVLVKGANSMIVNPNGHLYFNSTGNPGMATGGSGDVLTGIITSLLGQGYEPMDAVVLGVYLHGAAGDRVMDEIGEEGLVASDIILQLSPAMQEIKRHRFL